MTRTSTLRTFLHAIVLGSLLHGFSTVKAAPRIEIDREPICALEADNADCKEFVFIIRNTGDENLVVEDIVKSCGWKSAEVENGIIPAGEQTRLIALYITQPERDAFKLTLTVRSNAANAAEKHLIVAGRNRPPNLEVTPTTLKFVSIEGKPIPSQSIVIKARTGVSLTKSNIKYKDGKPNEKVFAVKPSEVSATQTAIEVTAAIPKELCKKGLCKQEALLDLDVLIQGESHTLSVPISIEILSEYQLAPPIICAPSAGTTPTMSVRVLLKHREGKPFRVTDIKSPTGVKSEVKQISGNSYFIYVIVEPLGLIERSNIQLTIEQGNISRVLQLPVGFSGQGD